MIRWLVAVVLLVACGCGHQTPVERSEEREACAALCFAYEARSTGAVSNGRCYCASDGVIVTPSEVAGADGSLLQCNIQHGQCLAELRAYKDIACEQQ